MDTINKVIKAKTSLKGNITRIETFVEKLTTETSNETELQVKLKKIDQLQAKLDELRINTFGLDSTPEESAELEEDFEQCEQRLENLEVRIKLLINSYKESNSVTTTVNQKETEILNVSTKVKIPPVVLPTFSGKYEYFSTFKSQFDDLITSNDKLTESQKLYYLNSCLSNEVKEFASTFDTFSSLYKALESRYDNKRLIIDIHVEEILNFKKIERENASEIRAMIDCINKNLRALKVLNYEQNDLFDIFLLNIMLKKLDKESRKNFELSQKNKEVPNFEQFLSFLEQRETVLLSVNRNCFPESKLMQKNPPKFPTKNKTLLVKQSNENKNCVMNCKDQQRHPLYRCPKFLQLTPQKRLEVVRLHKLCELCLRIHEKNLCFSTYTCRCKLKHSRLLCLDETSQTRGLAPATSLNSSEIKKEIDDSSKKENSLTLCNSVLTNESNQNKKGVLLSTGYVYLQNKEGKLIKCPCIFDSACNVNILSKKMSELLDIKLEKVKTSVSGLNAAKQTLKGRLHTFLSNKTGSFREQIEFLVTEKITGLTPNVTLDVSGIKIPEFLELADPRFFEAKEIHALLNADLFFRIMKENVYKVNEELLFRETEFGWVAGGQLNEAKTLNTGSCFLIKVSESTIEDTLKSFFDLESLGIKDDPCFRESDQAVKIFKESVKYNDRRYTVELPFRKHHKELNDNFPVAKQRFLNLWRRFQRNKELFSQYKETMQDYISQGIVEKVEDPDIVDEDKPIYYLPHQAVKKEGRVTTTTRIVFDAASHQPNELSLNDCLWPGPNLNPNLLDVLINFRLNKIAVSSDIRQAFLQICLAEKHKDAVRFLWTDGDPSSDKRPKLQVYRFNRVLFGVNASPFLLAATVKFHIEKYKEDYPTAVRHLEDFMYVDDWITGQDTPEAALLMSRCARNIMKEAGMVMRKWISNDSTLMSQWAAEGFDIYPLETSVSLGIKNTKVLGVTWQTQDDYLTLDTKGLLELISTNEITKRTLLQTIGRIFDPMGLLTPFTIRMKCLIQELWQEKFSWDESLPTKMTERWLTWCKELPLLDELRIPRLVLDSTSDESDDTVELHIFCDASKLAYGASAYVKVRKQNKILVNLITSKSRIAPLKSVTLPRLELLGALVAARLSCKVQEIVGRKKSYTVFHWTDSTIALFWIKGSPKRWKQFVSNRVQEIARLTDLHTWFHCPGKDNPSDLLSRGLSAESLLTSELWWHGPTFLHTNTPTETVQECPIPDEEDYLKELKSKDSKEKTLITQHSETVLETLLDRSNRYLKILRILCYIFRFIHNVKNPSAKRGGSLTADEITGAVVSVLKQLQEAEFSEEVSALKAGKVISRKGKIFNLSPFLDSQGLIRVGGRLQNSQLPYSAKHPILLPSKSKLTEMIVKYYHEKYFHLGPQHLLFQIRQKYWVIHGRNMCRKIVHNCIICFKARPKKYSQKMGNLPKERVTPDKVFNSTGIDLCGPFFIKNKYQRKGPEIKVYVCIFICLVTKAIHLEIISDLTSQALIATLKRFIARRGKCSKIFSDNGSNMIGADRELKALFHLVRNQDESLFAYFGEEGIKWSFIPPRSPNWGGLWEANIKSFKFHFKRVARNSKFTYEEFLTLVAQIEAILNSRPLTPLSPDVNDLEVLTPGHFLIGRPLTAIVEPTLTDVETNRLNVWQRITKMVQTIWKRWSLSYLNNLQQRGKWVLDKENLKIGDMVIIREDNLPACSWLMGRVVALYPGKDKHVRLVDVKTKNGIYKRSIARLSVLPIES